MNARGIKKPDIAPAMKQMVRASLAADGWGDNRSIRYCSILHQRPVANARKSGSLAAAERRSGLN